MRRLALLAVLAACTESEPLVVEYRPDALAGILIAPERRCAPYNRDDYPYPRSVESDIVARMGRIYGPYTGRTFDSTADTQIEHIVALSEAHDSGACAWDDDRKRAFARDLANLTLAGPAVNRDKSGKDPAEWLPERNRCWFLARVRSVKREYNLSMDAAEAAVVRSGLDACISTVME